MNNQELIESQELSIKIAELCLCCLLDGKKNVSELLESVNISQSAMSQHLMLLKEKKILKDEKNGKYIYYSIIDEQTIQILGFLKKICNKDIDN